MFYTRVFLYWRGLLHDEMRHQMREQTRDEMRNQILFVK